MKSSAIVLCLERIATAARSRRDLTRNGGRRQYPRTGPTACNYE
ncbi:hypothetical protein SAMCFNEI73_Ch2126 [Sinorhizobium americanum]|uniref:Uncharacterized protein n=1 Tax=Sinorhizobium americanum TaxID=194963 RepID=A0A1L3LMV2_9HYPH|nr:hypothetical protein SAMCFNEI73_Ch2126 [Sinorhizobium americanum]